MAGQIRCQVEAVITKKSHYKADPSKNREEAFSLEVSWLGGSSRYYCEDQSEYDLYQVGQDVTFVAVPFSSEEIRFSDARIVPSQQVQRNAAPPAEKPGKPSIFGGKAA